MSIIPQFLDSALTPVAQEVGNQLSDIVSLAFTPVMMLKSKRDIYLEKYVADLKQKVDKISEENLIEPPAHIVGPALEDIGKYYYDVQHVKEMYANLICSSLNKEKIEMIHPSYLQIIKSMSPLEADLFQNYFTGKFKSYNKVNKTTVFSHIIMNYNLLYFKKHNDTDNIFDNISILGVLPGEFLSEEFGKIMREKGNVEMQRCFLNLERLRLISVKKVKPSNTDLEYSKKLLDLQGESYKKNIGKIHIEITKWGHDFADITCNIPIYKSLISNSNE